MAETLKQLRDKLDAKRAQLRTLFKNAKTEADGEVTYDFERADAEWLGEDVISLEGHEKSLRVVEIVNERTAELDDLQERVSAQEKAEQAAGALEKRDREPVNRPGNPRPDNDRRHLKSVGEMVVEHKGFKQWRENGFDPTKCGRIELDDVSLTELKTLFETGAGWEPESTRTGRVVEAVTRPLQVTDIMPTGQTGQAAVVYMEETTRTHGAAEKAEGAAYAESEFVLAERTSTVRKVTDSIPVTDEQLEDVAMAQSYLEGRLLFGVTQRLDGQIVAGDGIAPNLDGILNVSGIQTRPKGADPVPDAIYKMMTDIRITGRASPTHTLLHPDDWTPIRLLRTSDGIYIWGSPSESGPERLWGLPVVQNESLTAGTGLVGSFMPLWIQLVERRGVIVEMGFVNDDFTKGRKTLRASGRWALPVYRPAAFGTVTGI